MASQARPWTERRPALPQAEAVLDALPVMVWVAGPDTGCVFLNRTWSAFTGRPFETDAGHGWAEAVHPDDLKACIAKFTAAFERREPFEMEWRLRRHDGAWRVVLDSGAPLQGPDGAFAGYVGSIVDLTERRALEDDLRRANERLVKADRAKAVFLNAASHELRTPLTPLLMQLQLLLAQAPDGTPLRQGLQVALRSAERLQLLVTDTLNVSRLHDGTVIVAAEPMLLRPMLAEVLQAFEVPARAKGVRLGLEHGPQGDLVGDGRRLAQVAANLVSNAIRATPRGGRVTVRVHEDPETAGFSVEDTGRGIAADGIPELFRPFTQLHDATALDSGSGLGLYICRGIVEAHDGRIEAASGGAGQGSCFRVELPRSGPRGRA